MNLKKLILPNLPYILFVYPFDKVAQAFRLTPGADLSAKLLSIGNGLPVLRRYSMTPFRSAPSTYSMTMK